MSEWQGKLTKQQAIVIIDNLTDRDDPYWSWVVEDLYDEATDTMPTIYHIFSALGVTVDEYKEATGAQNVNWPVGTALEEQDNERVL